MKVKQFKKPEAFCHVLRSRRCGVGEQRAGVGHPGPQVRLPCHSRRALRTLANRTKRNARDSIDYDQKTATSASDQEEELSSEGSESSSARGSGPFSPVRFGGGGR